MRLLPGLTCLCIALMVAGCSTDALVPQAPVGSATYKLSEPPEMRDTTQTARPAQALPPVTNAMADSTPPQNTLQAQARALEGHAARPARQQPVANEQPGATEEPAAEAPTQVAASSAAVGTIRFLPIIGAPVQAVTPLSRQLGSEARSHGLTIKSSADPNSQHILKGYLSAFNDGQKTTVIYVWDILDKDGQRLNRLQGQEEVPGAAKDPWSSVPPELMQAIATKTIAQYLAFRQAG